MLINVLIDGTEGFFLVINIKYKRKFLIYILIRLNLHTTADDVINTQTYYQFKLVTVIHFMNGKGVCSIIRRTVFSVYICLNHS